ncbi:MAG: hypothetical protein L0Z55_12270, partial [Planctomycetes bacterium]|nr:hypothetical protein [Planctomycetota bacterium]
EPSADWWKEGGYQEGCHFSRAAQIVVIDRLHAALVRDRLPTTVSAPEEWSLDESYAALLSYGRQTLSYVSQINAHSYDGTKRTGLLGQSVVLGKRLWMSEFGNGGSAGHTHDDMNPALQLCRRVIDDLKYMQPVAWVYWDAVESEEENVRTKSSWGLIHADYKAREYWLTKPYFAFGGFTKYIRPGFVFLEIADASSVAAFDPAIGRLVLVSMNDTRTQRTIEYDLSNFLMSNSSIEIVRTSKSENLKRIEQRSLEGQRFVAGLPPESVTTAIVDGVRWESDAIATNVNDNTVGEGLFQFNYFGDWQHYGEEDGAFLKDNHWSRRQDDAFEVRFTGNRVSVRAAVAPNHGIAGIALDNSEEILIDFYSKTRVEQVLVFSKGDLDETEHRLRVRVTGHKHQDATGTSIPADRVIVTSKKSAVSGF